MNRDINRNYVLVLPSWYPSRVDRFNGDFNERLVKAVSVDYPQIVLYVIGDPHISKTETVITNEPNLITYLVYYPLIELPLIDKLYSVWQYFWLNKRFIQKIIRDSGRPLLIHSYVFFKAMLLGAYIGRKYDAPVVITENWTAFYKTNPHGLHSSNRGIRLLYKYLLNSATHIIPVAKRLEMEIRNWSNQPQTVIPNVVDTGLFYFVEKNGRSEEFIFLHVSTMKYQKNTVGLLKAFEQGIREGLDAQLHLIGFVPKNIDKQIQGSSILKAAVHIHGELAYREVAHVMQMSNCLVMFSRYENLPCVILEALCCGMPVIATNVGGIPEVLNPENGILINSEDEEACASAMLAIAKTYDSYNRSQIALAAKQSFSYPVVAARVKKVYERVSG